jgi:tetratricopeptide (TPR) repeat protein
VQRARDLLAPVYGWFTEGFGTHLDQAIQLDPGLADAYYVRGLAYRGKGDLDLSLLDFNIAIEFNSELRPLAYFERGDIYRIRGDLDLAFISFNHAIQINPNLFEPYVGRGVIYNLRSKLDLALADFNRAIQLNPRAANVQEEISITVPNVWSHRSKQKSRSSPMRCCGWVR